jgi:2-iminoacetate synthase ThiH
MFYCINSFFYGNVITIDLIDRGRLMKRFKKVYIETTNICNLSCNFCPKTSRELRFMEVDSFKKIIDDVKQYSDYEIVGDTHLVGIPEKEVDLADHIYTLSTLEKEIENVDGLVPRYIKEVEAKKICQ